MVQPWDEAEHGAEPRRSNLYTRPAQKKNIFVNLVLCISVYWV